MLEEDKVAVAVFMGGIQGKQRGKKRKEGSEEAYMFNFTAAESKQQPSFVETDTKKKKSATCVYTSLTMLSGENAN